MGFYLHHHHHQLEGVSGKVKKSCLIGKAHHHKILAKIWLKKDSSVFYLGCSKVENFFLVTITNPPTVREVTKTFKKVLVKFVLLIFEVDGQNLMGGGPFYISLVKLQIQYNTIEQSKILLICSSPWKTNLNNNVKLVIIV